MSVNHNTALLRNVHETLVRSLDEMATRLAAGEPARRASASASQGSGSSPASAGSADLSPSGPRDVVAIAYQVAGNLTMIRCHAVARVASTLENAVKGLAEADRRGWSPAHAQVVSAAAVQVITALKRQLRHMVREENVLPVTLWAPWDELNRAIGETPSPPEALFEPNPQFDHQPFRTLDDGFLKDVVDGAIERFDAALVDWAKAQDEGEVLGAAKRISEVFDGLYGLQHRKAYYVYWLVWRARLTLVQLSDSSRLMTHRSDWLRELEAAGVELRKFANSCRAPQHARLMDALAPIVATPWPESWGQGHPVLVELDQRLGLTEFWEAAVLARNTEANQAKSTFLERRDDIIKSVRQLIRAAHMAFDSNKPKDLREMRVAAHGVLGKEGWLPSDDLEPLFSGVRRLIEIVDAAPASDGPSRARPAFSHEVSLEAAGLLILLEEVLDRPFPLAPDVRERIALQAARLESAWLQGPSALVHAAPVRWDPAYRQQKGREAVIQALAVMQGDLDGIEAAWLEVERGESETPEAVFQAAVGTLLLDAGVLVLLRYPAAAAIARELAARLSRFKPSRSSEADRSRLVSGLASLSGYITARRAGQNGARVRLVDAANTLGLDLAEAIEEETSDDPENLAFTTTPEASLSTVFSVSESSESSSVVSLALDAQSAPIQDSAVDGFHEVGLPVDEPGEGYSTGQSSVVLTPVAAQSSPDTSSLGEMHPAVTAPVSVGEISVDEASAEERDEEEDFDLFGEGRPDGLSPSSQEVIGDDSLMDDSPLVPETATGSPLLPGHSSGGSSSSVSWRQGPLPELPKGENLASALREGELIDRFKDRDIALCFIDEMESVLEQMAAARETLANEPYDAEAWADLRRGYHTLKGSGRMAGYFAIGEVAFWGEKTVSDRIAQQVGMTASANALLARAEEVMGGWLLNLKACQRTSVDGREMAMVFAELSDEIQLFARDGESNAMDGSSGDGSWLDDEDSSGALVPEDRAFDFEEEIFTQADPLLADAGPQSAELGGVAPPAPASAELAPEEHESGKSEHAGDVEEESSAEDEAWDEVFDAIEGVGAGLARLTQAIMRLRQGDE